MTTKNLKIGESILYDRSKLLIMTSLARMEWNSSFLELLEITGLTKGNMSSHLQKLELEGFVIIKKQFLEKKPHTSVEVTEVGKQSLKNHLVALQALIKQVKV